MKFLSLFIFIFFYFLLFCFNFFIFALIIVFIQIYRKKTKNEYFYSWSKYRITLPRDVKWVNKYMLYHYFLNRDYNWIAITNSGKWIAQYQKYLIDLFPGKCHEIPLVAFYHLNTGRGKDHKLEKLCEFWRFSGPVTSSWELAFAAGVSKTWTRSRGRGRGRGGGRGLFFLITFLS